MKNSVVALALTSSTIELREKEKTRLARDPVDGLTVSISKSILLELWLRPPPFDKAPVVVEGSLFKLVVGNLLLDV